MVFPRELEVVSAPDVIDPVVEDSELDNEEACEDKDDTRALDSDDTEELPDDAEDADDADDADD
jgi:hypothetical protein